MPKFIVGIREVHVSSREIEAEDKETAIQKIRDGEDGEEVMCEYSHTLDPEYWTVEGPITE